MGVVFPEHVLRETLVRSLKSHPRPVSELKCLGGICEVMLPTRELERSLGGEHVFYVLGSLALRRGRHRTADQERLSSESIPARLVTCLSAHHLIFEWLLLFFSSFFRLLDEVGGCFVIAILKILWF